MILQQTAQGVVVIAQADHARLAGALASRWGGDAKVFGPWEQQIRATTRHDDGWEAWDASPLVSPQGYPYDFISTPTAERLEIYRRGIGVVSDEPDWTALLISMHLTGLFLGRYEPGATRLVDHLPEPDRAMVQEFIDAEQTRQEELKAAVGADPLPHYRLLQLFDRLSLTFCLQPLDRVGRTTLEFVPLTNEEANEQLTMWWENERIVLDPYPFNEDEFEAALPVKILPNGPYEDAPTYEKLLNEAPSEIIRIPFARRPRGQ